MSRAIHKMRGDTNVAILFADVGRVSSITGSSVTFSNINVGSGANRTIIVGVSVKKDGNDNGKSTTITVGGVDCPKRVERDVNYDGNSVHCAIYSVLLTTQTGNVDIIIQGALSPHSWGMSAIGISNLSSPVPTDTAIGSTENSTSVVTTTTLDGQAGGIVFGVVSFGIRGTSLTWGSSMTERADLQTGGGSHDHRHGAGYDLIPAGRSASNETVTGGDGKLTLATASFR